MANIITTSELARSITRRASKQTYITVGLLADRDRVDDAYRAYAYFRWVDDTLDDGCGAAADRIAFLQRQATLLESCYQGREPESPAAEEQMLIQLVHRHCEPGDGLHTYLHKMMEVMAFDAARRGRLISASELEGYTGRLACAVTEALHHFIGHAAHSPQDAARYQAVTGAHITHMLRDTYDDVRAGYYNIPGEVLRANDIQPWDMNSPAYCAWVEGRVGLARGCFQTGREYLSRVEEPRCRLAGLAYISRFEWLLDAIEAEGYRLRSRYSERKSLGTGLRMGLSIISSLLSSPRAERVPQPVVSHPLPDPKGLQDL